MVSQCDLFDQMAKSASFRKSPTQSIDHFEPKKSDRSEIISKNKNYSSNFFQPIARLAWISSKLFIEKNSFRCHMVAMFKFQANAFQWKDNPRRLSPQRIVKILITSFESCQICQNFINLGLINIYLDWNYLVFWRVRRRLAKCSVLMN